MVEIGKLIKFDPFTKQIMRPTLILETRSGKSLGLINYTDLNMSFTAKGLQEISFTTHKVVNGVECEFWDKLRGLAVIRYMLEGEKYIRFEASFGVIDGDETVKSCNAVSLETELGQRTLREFYVNDPNNIQEWLDYDEEFNIPTPTVLWDEYDTAHSLLARALERVPHWSVGEVSEYFNDGSVVSRADMMQRTFSINGSTVYDFLEGDVCREFGCAFIYDTVNRTVNCYNLDDCVWMFSSSPDLNGKVAEDITYRNNQFYDKDGNIIDNDNVYIEDSEGTLCKVIYRYCEGIGRDTGVLMSKSRLANSFQIDENKDSVKNLFHISAGDDIMTNLGVAAANATGNTDIVLFDNFVYEDMSDELRTKLLGDGDTEIGYINYLNQEQRKFYGEPEIVDLITSRSYETSPTDLETANTFYDQFMSGQLQSGLYLGYVNSLGKESYYEHTMSPSTVLNITTSSEQIYNLLMKMPLDTLLVTVKPTASAFNTVTNMVEKYAKTYVDTRYEIKVKKETASYQVISDTVGYWRGEFIATSYTDATDTCESGLTSVRIQYVNSSDTSSAGQTAYIEYNKQKILMQIANGDLADLNMVVNGQFIPDTELRDLLEQYSLSMLEGYYKGMQECVATLIELKNKLDLVHSASFTLLYNQWQQRCAICEQIYNFRKQQVTGWQDITAKLAIEIGVFQSYLDIQRYLAVIKQNGAPITIDEMCAILGVNREQGNLILDKAFAGITKCKVYNETTHKSSVVYLSAYNITITNDLYKEYCSYLRETEYQNNNYISDGLSDAEILKKGKELIDNATKELRKATVLQRSISGDFNNIFAVEELQQLYSSFDLYNYVRCIVDGHIYKLRLMQVSFNEGSPESLPVTFAQYIESIDGKMNDVQSILNSAQSISSSYSSTYQQARSGGEAGTIINKIQNDGLNSAEVLIKNSDAEEVIIDNTGIVARSMNDVGAYGNHQLKIIGNGMYLTEDNWETVSMAVGLGLYNGEWKYGVWADLLYGKIILGEQLVIGGDDDNVKIQGDEIIITNINDTYQDTYTRCIITTSGNEIFKIENKWLGISYDIFNIDSEGVLNISNTTNILVSTHNDDCRVGRIVIPQYGRYDNQYYNDPVFDQMIKLPREDVVNGKIVFDLDGLAFYGLNNDGSIDTNTYTKFNAEGIDKSGTNYLTLNSGGISTSFFSINGYDVNSNNHVDFTSNEIYIYSDNWNIDDTGDANLNSLELESFKINGIKEEIGSYLTSLDSLDLSNLVSGLTISTMNVYIGRETGQSSGGSPVMASYLDIGKLRIIAFQSAILYNTNAGYNDIPIGFQYFSNGDSVIGFTANITTSYNESYTARVKHLNNSIYALVYTPSADTFIYCSAVCFIQSS